MADHDDTYLHERLDPIGITDRYNWFDYKLDRHHPYFQPDDSGHIEIFYPSATSRLLQGFYKQTRNKKDEIFTPISRTRYRPGEEPPGKDGKPTKYKLPYGSKSALWIGPVMLRRIREKVQMPLIILTEGEFKTAVGDRHGLPILGIGGVQNFGEQETERFLSELLHVTRQCGVMRLCLLFDSDLFDLGSGIEPGGDPAGRPRGTFFSAAKRFKERCQLAGLDAYIAWPRPGDKKHGLDDLVLDTIGPAPAELLKLESYEMVGEMAVFHWTDHCRTGFAASIATAMGWDLEQIYTPPEGEKKVSKAKQLKSAIGWHALQPSIAWMAAGRRLMRELERLVAGIGGESKHFVCHKIALMSDHQIRGLWALDSPTRFWERHRETLKGWESFKWGRDTYNIVAGEAKLEDLDTSINLENHGGQLYSRSAQGGKRLVGTFTFQAQWHLVGKREGYILETTDSRGHQKTVMLPSTELANIHAFKTRMLEHGLIWLGSPQEHMTAVMEAMIDVPEAQSIDVLGWQPEQKVWLWNNGAFDGNGYRAANEMGFVEVGDDFYFIPGASSMYKHDEGFAPNRFLAHAADKSITSWEKWFSAAAPVYGVDRAMIAMAFVTATVFCDFIREKLSFFPILFLFGLPQMGKSTFATSCLSFFGKPLPRVNMEAGTTTIVGLQRVMARFRNVPAHLDEVSNRCKPELLDQMKNIFDGVSGTQGVKTPGTETRTYPILSTAIASGQHLPSHDPALVRRCVVVEFPKRPAPSIIEKNNMDDLRSMEHRGLTGLIHELLKHRGHLEQYWSMTFARVYKTMLDLMNAEALRLQKPMVVTDSVLQAHAALFTPLIALSKLIEGGKLVDEMSIIMAAIALLPLHSEATEATDESETFWHYLQLARVKYFVRGEGRDYLIEEGRIYLRFRRCHTAYQRVATKEIGANYLPEASMKALLRQSEAYIGKEKRRLYPGGDPLDVEVFDLDKIEFTED